MSAKYFLTSYFRGFIISLDEINGIPVRDKMFSRKYLVTDRYVSNRNRKEVNSYG